MLIMIQFFCKVHILPNIMYLLLHSLLRILWWMFRLVAIYSFFKKFLRTLLIFARTIYFLLYLQMLWKKFLPRTIIFLCLHNFPKFHNSMTKILWYVSVLTISLKYPTQKRSSWNGYQGNNLRFHLEYYIWNGKNSSLRILVEIIASQNIFKMSE